MALDDVGADVRSLALLPFIEPDVIKLDLSLVQHRPSTDQAAIVTAVAAERERTGAQILAEGIEDDAPSGDRPHARRDARPGLALGPSRSAARRSAARRRACAPASARRGRAGAPPSRWSRPSADGRRDQEPAAADEPSPREPGAAHRRGRRDPLRLPGRQALHPRRRSAATRRWPAASSLVGAFGVGLGEEPAPGVRGAHIDADDPLAGEWSVVVIGPHFAGALVARDLGDTGARPRPPLRVRHRL